MKKTEIIRKSRKKEELGQEENNWKRLGPTNKTELKKFKEVKKIKKKKIN